MEKNIDFDEVADLYDVYVQTQLDIPFWKQEVQESPGTKVLELMCGSGRIGKTLVDLDISYTGLDYSEKLLQQFQAKIPDTASNVKLVVADARSFQLLPAETFDFIFLGFHSLSEVLRNEDKAQVLQRVRAHLTPSGWFTFSLHNPAIRSATMGGSKSDPVKFDMSDGSERTLEFSHQYNAPSSDGIVTGTQFYVIRDKDGRVVEERTQDVKFHLITRQEIELMLEQNGFRVIQTWGDFNRSELTKESPFMIFRCMVASSD